MEPIEDDIYVSVRFTNVPKLLVIHSLFYFLRLFKFSLDYAVK